MHCSFVVVDVAAAPVVVGPISVVISSYLRFVPGILLSSFMLNTHPYSLLARLTIEREKDYNKGNRQFNTPLAIEP